MQEKTAYFYGSENPYELMDTFYQIGNDTLLSLRNFSTNNAIRKSPRTWGTLEATDMVKVSAPTFRKLLETHKDVEGIIEETNGNNKTTKRFTLRAINQLRDYANTRYVRPPGSKPLTIAVSNLKGGVAKTQTAVDLAKKSAIEGQKVLLLDFDAQGTATLISSGIIPNLELNYEDTITNTLLIDYANIHNIIIPTHFDGFDIIPANLAIQDCDLLLPNDKENNLQKLGSPYWRLTNALALIKDNYDLIIIDCGPNISFLTLNALIACDGMLIPIPPNMNDYSSFIMYCGTLQNTFKELGDKKLIYLRLLLSMHSGSNEALQMENIMRQQFGRFVLTNHMCETVEVSKAANEIGTIYDIIKPRGSRDAYRRAMQHLNDVNMEIINNFRDIWALQASRITSTQ